MPGVGRQPSGPGSLITRRGEGVRGASTRSVYGHREADSVYLHQVRFVPPPVLTPAVLPSGQEPAGPGVPMESAAPDGASGHMLAALLRQLEMRPEQLIARINERRARRGVSPLDL